MRHLLFRQQAESRIRQKLHRIIRYLMCSLGMMMLLTGCNDLNSQFTCPKQPGINCQSLDQVNTLIDEGKLASDSSSSAPKMKANTPSIVMSANQDFKNKEDSPPALRTPDNVMCLWIAPYVDTEGNYFSASVVYHVIQPSQWVGESADYSHQKAGDSAMISPAGEDHHV